MAFLTKEQINAIGFKYIGDNVKISDKAAIYSPDLISIEDNSRVDDFCLLSGNIKIGKNVHVAAYCNLAGGKPGIEMEDFSGLAYGCHVFTQSDDYSGETMTNPTVPKKYKKETYKKVHIGKHVIVGTKSIILPGVNVAEGCSVGAMTMLTKSTQPWGIYFGIPAKRIKERKKALLELESEYIKEY
ncbi:acyltransferase [Aeromonas allosaccharophila]|uniref:Acyltransferase n=1 Tax=Aeromonas allosaccharophila TaxID=656 RepID=A0ABZ0FEH7_9GAMM|nr:acyltransferase [Aeromonas allosaccharophila]WOE67778.1 acyltransferase [Aeromonas allosaccharophila]